MQGTNTYLIGTGKRRILVDTAEGMPAYVPLLEKVLADTDAEIEMILITHWHQDHTQGIPDVLSVCAAHQQYKPPVYKFAPQEQSYLPIEDGNKFSVEGATLVAVHTPGHTSDHVAFWLEEEDAFFSGDNVLGQGTTVFEDLSAYMTSLKQMSSLIAEGKGKIYPAHGPVIEQGQAKIEEYISHRTQREDQIVGILSAQKDHGMEPIEIVKILYKGYPESLYFAAEHGVRLHLEKLVNENRVQDNDDMFSLTDKSVL